MAEEMYGKGSVSLDQWSNRWQDGKIGFHRQHIHTMMEKYAGRMINGREGIRIFFPLCGKAVDMKWLADQGHTVVGVELSSKACQEFFQEQNVEYTEEKKNKFTLFKSKDGKIRIYCGDFYEFDSSYEGKMDAFWDRAAIIAIDTTDWKKYCDVIFGLCSDTTRGLLVTVDYDPTKFPGPPHFVPEEQIHELYGHKCNVDKIDYLDVLQDAQRSWGLDSFHERVYFITMKST